MRHHTHWRAKPSGPGWRVTYFDAQNNPVASFWGMEPMQTTKAAQRWMEGR